MSSCLLDFNKSAKFLRLIWTRCFNYVVDIIMICLVISCFLYILRVILYFVLFTWKILEVNVIYTLSPLPLVTRDGKTCCDWNSPKNSQLLQGIRKVIYCHCKLGFTIPPLAETMLKITKHIMIFQVLPNVMTYNMF